MKLHNRHELRPKRKGLRKNLTPAEAYLWKQLNQKKLDGRKFRRQHSIGPYIVDFYCSREKLIIKLDGQIHNIPQVLEYDQRRTNYLNSKGYRVIRFENKLVFDCLEGVLKEIRDNFKCN